MITAELKKGDEVTWNGFYFRAEHDGKFEIIHDDRSGIYLLSRILEKRELIDARMK